MGETRSRGAILACALVSAAAALALVLLSWPAQDYNLSFALQAAMAIYLATVAAMGAARYREARDPHALFLTVGIGVLAVQAAFCTVWMLTSPITVTGSLGGGFGVASPNTGAVPPLAWQGGWTVSAACFWLALPVWERRGRRPISPLAVSAGALATIATLDVVLLAARPGIGSSMYEALVDEPLPRPGVLGIASWILGLAAIALLVAAATREWTAAAAAAGGRHVWIMAALVLAVPLQVAVLLRPTEGLPPVQWADLLQPAVAAILFASLLAQQRADASRMRRATDRADEVMGGRAQIASTIAHEVRGPVATVRGIAATTLAHYDRLSDDERRELLGLIEQESRRLLTTVDQTSLAFKIDAGTLRFEPRGVELDGVVRAGVEAADPGDHPVTVEADEGVTITADRARLAEVVRQLVDNAAKFSPPGAPIAVVARRDDRAAVLEVTDAGPGIPADRRDHVFTKFPSWRPAGYEEQPGSGLGLFICRGLVAEHSGEISVVDSPGGGTMLRVRLPVEG